MTRYLFALEKTIGRCEEHLGLTPLARARLGIGVGQARLTAAALNEMLRAGTQGVAAEEPGEDWRKEWELA